MKDMYHLKKSVILFGFFLSLSINLNANQADIDAEKAEFIKVFSGTSLSEMKDKVKSLEYKGYSDPKIFDPIEKQVQENMFTAGKQELDAIAWLIRALGFSGNEKYLETLNKVAVGGSEKLRRHANNAISDLPDYARTNSVISKGLVEAAAGRLEQQRTLNMLLSDENALVRLGLRQVYEKYSKGMEVDKQLLDEVKRMLIAAIEGDISREQEDNVAWMCKVLGSTGDPAYTAVLNDVIQKSSSPKIRKYAQGAM